jgi:hypothetical protein
MKLFLGIILSLIVGSSVQAGSISNMALNPQSSINMAAGTHINPMGAGIAFGQSSTSTGYFRNPIRVSEPAALLLLGAGLIVTASTVRKRNKHF